LDALYFRDKVHMRTKSTYQASNCVPKLNFFPMTGEATKQLEKKKDSSNEPFKKIVSNIILYTQTK